MPPLKCHLIPPQNRVPIPCHSANNETECVQVSGSLVKKSAESEHSAQQAPKRVTLPLSKRGGNNDDNLPCFAGERRTKMKCSFSKIRQAGCRFRFKNHNSYPSNLYQLRTYDVLGSVLETFASVGAEDLAF